MEFNKTEMNQVIRGAAKGSYNMDEIYSILDSTEICNIAFNYNGKALVQPINYGRDGDLLYIHGSPKNRMTEAIVEAGEVSLSVMILDSMKLTRSAFHHSVNFRSVVVFGKVRNLTSDEEKLKGLKSIINHFVPNRWDSCRHPNNKELKATKVIEIAIQSASAKIANKPFKDNKADYDLDFWAGEIPVKTIYEYPIPDEELKQGIEIPSHVLDFYNNRKDGK
jgi:uncharacterized protein